MAQRTQKPRPQIGYSACVNSELRDGKHLADIAILADLLAQSAGSKASSLSRQLISRHGSLVSLLLDVKWNKPLRADLPENAVTRIGELVSLLMQAWETEVRRGPILSSSDAVHKYLQLDMAGVARERFRVLFLDSANHLLADEIMWEGTVNKVQVHPREILRQAILNDASAVILAHNHPSGIAQPSNQDVEITRQIIAACTPLGIKVHDHLIVTRTKVTSVSHMMAQMSAVRQVRQPQISGAYCEE